jgi:iron(III) transport system permease protein
MLWIDAIINTALLSIFTIAISAVLGITTAVSAWKSNSKVSYYTPLLTISVPPWLLAYYLSDGITLNNWLAASLSLGICSSVYFHTICSASLSSTAYRNYEMIKSYYGDTFKSLFLAVRPSILNSFVPASLVVTAEVVTDFGVSNYYGINTITMVSYNVWTSSWNLSSVIPGLALLFIIGVTLSQKNYNMTNATPDGAASSKLSLLSIAPTALLLVFSLFKAIQWSYGNSSTVQPQEFLYSAYLIACVTVLCFTVALVYLSNILKSCIVKLGLFAYSMSGTVIAALFLLIPLPLGLLLVLAILSRYFGLATNALSVAEASSSKLLEVAQAFSSSRLKLLKIKLSIYRQPLIISFCMIALDVLRELPISMIIHPMNFTTIAMRMNYIARTEDLNQLGYYAVAILLVSITLTAITVKLSVKR